MMTPPCCELKLYAIFRKEALVAVGFRHTCAYLGGQVELLNIRAWRDQGRYLRTGELVPV